MNYKSTPHHNSHLKQLLVMVSNKHTPHVCFHFTITSLNKFWYVVSPHNTFGITSHIFSNTIHSASSKWCFPQMQLFSSVFPQFLPLLFLYLVQFLVDFSKVIVYKLPFTSLLLQNSLLKQLYNVVERRTLHIFLSFTTHNSPRTTPGTSSLPTISLDFLPLTYPTSPVLFQVRTFFLSPITS